MIKIFKLFKFKSNLLENTVVQPSPSAANGILKNATSPKLCH